jgi:hypothetical protein
MYSRNLTINHLKNIEFLIVYTTDVIQDREAITQITRCSKSVFTRIDVKKSIFYFE